MYFALRNSLIEKNPSFEVDPPFQQLKELSYSLLHHKELTSTISQVVLPAADGYVSFVYLNGDRLYTERGKNLYVYSLSDFSSPIATYPLGGKCVSGIITDNRLYLGGWTKKLHIFEVMTTSSTQPLKRVTVIETKDWVSKILRVGHELLLGQSDGYF